MPSCNIRPNLGFGLSVVLCAFGFTAAYGSPAVNGISPAFGHPGDVVTLSGSGFNPNAADNVVNFGPNRAPVLSASPTQLTVQVPNGQPLGPTTVSVNSGLSSTTVSANDTTGPTFQTAAGSKSSDPPSRP